MWLAPKRILIVDDNADIHTDIRKILATPKDDEESNALKSNLFSEPNKNNKIANNFPTYLIDSAYQGQEAIDYIQQSLINKQPYALAFVDIRMPPGWDGIETVKQIWKIDKNIQIVICTAYSDYSWKDMIDQLNTYSNFLILKKPFEVVEIRQLAAALTTKWQLNQFVEKQIDLLEATIEERTLELKQAKEIAEQANHLKSEFLENISHELLTPLTSIIGFSQLIHDQQVDIAKCKEFSNYILYSTNELMLMINNILDVARIDSGHLELNYADINLHALVNEVKNMHYDSILSKNLQLDININPSLPKIRFDPIKLKHIIFNLVSNAIKFTAINGKISINVKEVGKEQFRIEVIDTGIGIHDEDKNKLFVNFQQLNSSSSKQYAGIGMGLALVRHIVESQGGNVGVESTYGKGSNFYVVLPCSPSET